MFSPACEGRKEMGLGGTDGMWQETLLAPSLHLACLAPSLGPSWLQLTHCKDLVSSRSTAQLQSHDSLEISPQAQMLLTQKKTLSIANPQIHLSMHFISPEAHHSNYVAFSCSASSIRLGTSRMGRSMENRAHTHSPALIPAELLLSKTLKYSVMRTLSESLFFLHRIFHKGKSSEIWQCLLEKKTYLRLQSSERSARTLKWPGAQPDRVKESHCSSWERMVSAMPCLHHPLSPNSAGTSPISRFCTRITSAWETQRVLLQWANWRRHLFVLSNKKCGTNTHCISGSCFLNLSSLAFYLLVTNKMTVAPPGSLYTFQEERRINSK